MRRSWRLLLAVVVVSALSETYAHAQTPEEAAASTAASILANTRLRFYTDLGYGKPLQEKLPVGGLQAGTYSFQIADLHVFATSRLAEDWSVLSELLITSDFTNEAAAEMDRLLIQFTPSKHVHLAMGKYNSGIGYYPNEFHRAKFYQTATGRPMMFTDEDNGGILPVHQVGMTAQGEIPSGELGLHYLGEIGNGRSFRHTSAEVQNWADENNLKAVNGGLFIRPDRAPDLQAGVSVYRDTLETDDGAKTHETIVAAHTVWMRPDLELLNEAVFVRHTPVSGGETITTKAFYTQFSRRLENTRPYVRYDYWNRPADDPVYNVTDIVPPAGVRQAISVGVRQDLTPLVAFKVQYDRARQSGVWANGVHAQIAVAF